MTAAAASQSRSRTLPTGRSLGYAGLLALRDVGKSLTDDRCLTGCGRRINPVGDAGEIPEITVYCDRAWLCPVCGYHAARDQSRELATALMAWTSQGGSVAFLTLTQSHSVGDQLSNLWDRLGHGWAALVRGSGWRTDQEIFGLRGYARVTEVVHHSQSGWNVHLHVPLLLVEAPDDQQLYELEHRLVARFIRGIKVVGGRASCAGQDLCPMLQGSECQLADYCAKGTTVWHSNNSRTPMAILADFKETGDGLALWKEFSAAVTVRKRKRHSPSHEIANLVRSWQ